MPSIQKYLTLPSGSGKPMTLEEAVVLVLLVEPGLVAEPVEYTLVIRKPELVVAIVGPVVIALVLVVMFEPVVIAGHVVMALMVVMIAGPVEVAAEPVEYALVVPPLVVVVVVVVVVVLVLTRYDLEQLKVMD